MALAAERIAAANAKIAAANAAACEAAANVAKAKASCRVSACSSTQLEREWRGGLSAASRAALADRSTGLPEFPSTVTAAPPARAAWSLQPQEPAEEPALDVILRNLSHRLMPSWAGGTPSPTRKTVQWSDTLLEAFSPPRPSSPDLHGDSQHADEASSSSDSSSSGQPPIRAPTLSASLPRLLERLEEGEEDEEAGGQRASRGHTTTPTYRSAAARPPAKVDSLAVEADATAGDAVSPPDALSSTLSGVSAAREAGEGASSAAAVSLGADTTARASLTAHRCCCSWLAFIWGGITRGLAAVLAAGATLARLANCKACCRWCCAPAPEFRMRIAMGDGRDGRDGRERTKRVQALGAARRRADAGTSTIVSSV